MLFIALVRLRGTTDIDDELQAMKVWLLNLILVNTINSDVG